MRDSFASPGIELPSPTLSARLREMADYLAAPGAERLTEEQRALALGIARRLIVDVASRLDEGIDPAALWDDWIRGGIPGAERLAAPCFARGEEHRWREQSAQRAAPPLVPLPDEVAGAAGEGDIPAADAPMSDANRFYLALQIADRRRADALGNPCIAVADLDTDLFRALLLDIAAWRLVELGSAQADAARLGDAVRNALAQQARETGIDAAAAGWHRALEAEGALAETAAHAIARHDWPALIALAAAAHRQRYSAMALRLLTAETAALPSLLAPLRIDRAAIAPLEASLSLLPCRTISGSAAPDEDYAALLTARAGGAAPPAEGGT
ncbi:hypothetical protein [Sphingopyxis flava]|uniref:Uncharacterized protein n=1 Tax=Sphingopyxis flava TaxID=1507287 RepID=A0A1T5BD06_9SPHN|nr:hypothetical protein [Sphingopyxis flava]SKB45108.1 hypothetical protein SAMN06295937_1006102 [Sphingopyxis flava]